MAGASTETKLSHHVYSSLQDASCPLVEDLYLQDVEDMLQLLVAPSQRRTHILAWICTSINPKLAHSKAISNGVKDHEDAFVKGKRDVLRLLWTLVKHCVDDHAEMAVLGKELMLCKADDLDLIRGNACPQRQLRFLEQLLALVPGCQTSAGLRVDGEVLLNEIFAPENLPHLTQTIKPAFDPWPAYTEYRTKACPRPCRADVADVAALLQTAQSELKQLQSKCDFLCDEGQTPAAFSPSLFRLAAQDLQQLMATFSHVYESDLKAFCSREPPRFSTGTEVFQRVHQLLLACDTELEMLNELCEASAFISKEMKQLQTRPQYWSQGKKYTLSEQLVEMNRRIRDFLLHLHSSCDLITGSSSSNQFSDLKRL